METTSPPQRANTQKKAPEASQLIRDCSMRVYDCFWLFLKTVGEKDGVSAIFLESTGATGPSVSGESFPSHPGCPNNCRAAARHNSRGDEGGWSTADEVCRNKRRRKETLSRTGAKKYMYSLRGCKMSHRHSHKATPHVL